MLIRPAIQSDFSAWSAMVADYDPSLTGIENRAWARFFAPSPRDFCVVAEKDGQAVAFMMYTFHDFALSNRPVCYMEGIYTRPEYRGQGMASALIGYLTSMATIMGWGRIYWVTEPNNPARSLYDKIAKCEFVRYHMDFV
jgi:GNAT superfamily N-acetyltransferase